MSLVTPRAERRSTAPRILYISPFYPLRPSGASEVRAVNVARALQDVGSVKWVVVEDEKGGDNREASAAKPFDLMYSVTVKPRPNTTVSQKLRWAVDPKMAYPHGRGVDTSSLQRVLRTLADFDLVWFFKLRTANMFPQWSWPRSVVDIDDVPSAYERSLLATEVSMPERLKIGVRWWNWRRRERLLAERFTVLGVCSDADKQYLQRRGVTAPVHVLPNGADPPATVPVRRIATPPRIGFIGRFDYVPNRDGVEWFVRHCWPTVRRELPGVRLRLVGPFTDSPLKPPGDGIDGLGFIPDVSDEISSWSVMIVPVRIGAGTRGKIAHAFSMKCPIVSTSLGAYGYDAGDGDTLKLSDTAQEFAAACVAAVRDPDAATAMAERAWQEFLGKWTWQAIRPRVRSAAEECLRRAGV